MTRSKWILRCWIVSLFFVSSISYAGGSNIKEVTLDQLLHQVEEIPPELQGEILEYLIGPIHNKLVLSMLRKNQQHHTIKPAIQHPHRIQSVDFSPDGKVLAFGSSNGTITLWNIKEKACIKTLKGHRYKIHRILFSPDGKKLVSTSTDHSVRIWDIQKEKEENYQAFPNNPILAIAFSPDGERIALSCSDKTIQIWDNQQKITTLFGHDDPILALAFTDTHHIVSGSSNGSLYFWDINTQTVTRRISKNLPPVQSIAISPDGKLVAWGLWDRTIRIWDVQTGEHITHFTAKKARIDSLAFNPRYPILASGTRYGTIQLWDIQNNKRLDTLAGHTDRISSLCFSSNGKHLASSSIDHTVRLWDLFNPEEQAALKLITHSQYRLDPAEKFFLYLLDTIHQSTPSIHLPTLDNQLDQRHGSNRSSFLQIQATYEGMGYHNSLKKYLQPCFNISTKP